jgi:TRAP-type mannitol/chloroaromatic compound transport system permease large subunit
MRQVNRRFVVTGAVLIAAIGFFVYMMGMAPRSNDPKALMETVGQVSGVVAGISVAMIIFGLIGRKA